MVDGVEACRVVVEIGVVDGEVAVVDTGGGRYEGEYDGGYGNADEDEDEALLSEHVANRLGHREPWFYLLRRVRVRHRLALVSSENQLRSHLFLLQRFVILCFGRIAGWVSE